MVALWQTEQVDSHFAFLLVGGSTLWKNETGEINEVIDRHRFDFEVFAVLAYVRLEHVAAIAGNVFWQGQPPGQGITDDL